MPALGELTRRKFLATASNTALLLFTACSSTEMPITPVANLQPPTQTPRSESQKPLLTPEPKIAVDTTQLTTISSPTSPAREPTVGPSLPPRRAGPLPTADIPELRGQVTKTSTAKPETPPTKNPTRAPTPQPTETPQPENHGPLHFNHIWQKEMLTQFISPAPTFVDRERVYVFNWKTGLVCYKNTNGEELWTWGKGKLPSNQAEFHLAETDTNYVFAQYLGNLQVSNRLTASTFIEAIDKHSGKAHSFNWSQPQNGNHQFFYRDGIIERMFLQGGTIETSFEVYDQTFQALWKSPGRLFYTNSKEQLAVIRPAMDTTRDFKTADLYTGENKKKIFSPLLGDSSVNSPYFEGSTMYAIIQGRVLAINLHTSGTIWGPGKPEIKESIDSLYRESKGKYLYAIHGKSDNRALSAIDKQSGKALWTQYTKRGDFPILGLTTHVVLAQDIKQRKSLGFDTQTGEYWEQPTPQMDELLGSYKETIATHGKTQGNTGVYGISARDGRSLFSYRGYEFYPAVSGRALVFGMLGSNKLWVIDLETRQETLHTMPGEVIKVISPKDRFFLVLTSGRKQLLTAITV